MSADAEKKRYRPEWFVFVIYAIGIVFGTGLILRATNALRQHSQSAQWPTTPGVIIESKTIYSGPSIRGPDRASPVRADVTYRYEVQGKSFSSKQISLWSPDLGWAQGAIEPFVAAHPTNSSVQVRYDPGHPENALLIPGANKKMEWLIIASGALILVAGFLGIGTRFRNLQILHSLPPEDANAAGFIAMADFQKAKKAIIRNSLAALGFVLLPVMCLLTPVMSGPDDLPGAIPLSAGLVIGGIIGIFGVAWFVRRVFQQGRKTACPRCLNQLEKRVVETGFCPTCGSRVFSDLPIAPSSQ
jgi:hypothetical protein